MSDNNTAEDQFDDGIAEEQIEVDLDAKVAELAALPPLKYAQIRKAEAKALGVTTKDLDAAVRKARQADNTDSDGTTADELVNMVKESATLFHNEEKTPFAWIRVDKHLEVWPLESEGFREWASFEFYQRHERAPSDSAIATAMNTLRGVAKFEGDCEQVWLRSAPFEGGYVIDLCDDQWRVVWVRPGNWQVLHDSPIRFTRTQSMQGLPLPEGQGDLDRIWNYINVVEADRPFVLAFMLESLRPDTPFPVLEIGGYYGSAKSTTQKTLRRCIDPNRQDLRVEPKSLEDLLISARNNWVVSLNNLSHLSASRQDVLCSISTGGGVGTRTFYTNTEETTFEVKRPVIINGIRTLATAPDLVDRVIRLELPKLNAYRQESEIWTQFEEDRAQIFAGLLDLFAEVLRILPEISIGKPYRMADFCYLGEAVYKALGMDGTFMEAYAVKRSLAAEKALDGSGVAHAIRTYVERHQYWKGPVGRLYEALEQFAPKHGSWPNSPRGLGDSLRTIAPPLSLMGITVDFDPTRHNDGIHVAITKSAARDAEKKAHSPSSQRSQHSQGSPEREERERREHRERGEGDTFPEARASHFSEDDERAIRQWMADEGEDDPEMIDHVIEQCRRDPEHRRNYLRLAVEARKPA